MDAGTWREKGRCPLNLRKLELAGFKTFARRTEVLLPGGVTGIVGPNGSGKSNLADAVRWVLGEQSLQHIRSKKTEDVIFAGGANRPPLGMAEVTLTLDNTSGWIPLDFSEVTVTRRAYRSGENEYFINGSRVRLRDVVDLRNRAGFGQSSYSVIGQGLVDAVLSQRPEERRALFEEAAGIRHYQAKRDQTLDQLAHTRQNLIRVQDIVAEIAPRLESLRRQSEKARQYSELSEELRTLQIRWFAARSRVLQRRAADAATQLAEAQQSLAAAQAAAAEADLLLAARQADRELVERQLAGHNQRAAELRSRKEALQGRINLAGEKLRFLEERGQEASRELAELAASLDALAQQRHTVASEITALEEGERRLAAELAEAERGVAGRQQQERELAQRLRGARDDLAQQRAARDRAQAELAQIDQRQAELERQAREHDEDLARKRRAADSLAADQAALQRELQALRAAEERQSGELENARLSATAAATAVAEGARELDAARRQHHELATRMALLRELQDNLEGLAEGTRRLLRTRRPGVLGSVAEGLRVRPGFERAIAAALAHKLDAVLIAGEPELLKLLASDNVDEATLLIDLEHTPAELRPLPGGEGIRAVDNPSPALTRLLAGTVIVDGLPAALDAARQGWRAVTRAGDLVEPDGSVTRRGVSAGEAVLKRQQALEEVDRQVAEASSLVSARELEQAAAQQAAQAAAAQLKALEDEARKQAAGRQQRASQARELAHQLQTAKAQVEWLANLQSQVASQADQLAPRRQTAVAALDQASARLPELEKGLQQADLAADGRQAAAEQDAARINDLRVELGVARQRMEHSRLQASDLAGQAARAERQLADRQARDGEQTAVLDQLRAQMALASADLDRAAQQLDAELEAIAPLRNRIETLSAEWRTLAASGAEARDAQAELDRRCYRLQLDGERHAEELETLGATLLEELQLTLDVLPEPRPDVPEPSKRELDTLRARIAALGPINPGALEEFGEVEERHAFLTTQAADLEQAAQQLQGVIAELEELTRRQFMETFELVSKEFVRYFQLMFGGGEVRIFLTDPENVTSSGIEILAQPPGKRLQALPLLSGGERALVATGLLFAILSVRPVPFCLLDEVDAALDEANVRRFCQALQSLAETTQFLVITHNRETMAIADALYGVSMSQDGVSKLVSLRLPREDRWADETPQAALLQAPA